MSNIPTVSTHPELTEDEINWLRLQWRADKAPEVTAVRKCTSFEGRYHVSYNGVEVPDDGHWPYEATWYLIVGAQRGAEVFT